MFRIRGGWQPSGWTFSTFCSPSSMALVYPSTYHDNGYHSLSRRNSVYGTAPSMPYSSQAIYSNTQYSRPSFDMYGHAASAPIGHGRGYDDIDVDDGYYVDDRRRSSSYLPMTAQSTMSMPSTRYRRNSGVSFSGVPHSMTMPTDYRRPSSLRIKFKRKSSLFAGINLAEAQDRVRLSNNDAFTYHDFHADSQRKILLKIKWTGYSSMTYEIPLDGYDGRVSLQTLARRISRACVHYLQANVIPVPWNAVQLHHLEEVAYGVWQPRLSA